ncbi:MAG: hypothetical protein KIT74_04480 [Fimbriimonadales bacterium]|nr:hypothetical protein [Fimbriimonadales bacterium]
MRAIFAFLALTFLAVLAGCGNSLHGTWVAKVRIDDSKPQTDQTQKMFEEAQARLETTGRRTIELMPGGKYRETFSGGYNLGTWRVKGDTLYLNATNYSGTEILAALQSEKPFRIAKGGKEILPMSATEFGYEEYFVRE